VAALQGPFLGTIAYLRRRNNGWPQIAREIIATEKSNYIIMMTGNFDRQTNTRTRS
jgi:hypothetical protein